MKTLKMKSILVGSLLLFTMSNAAMAQADVVSILPAQAPGQIEPSMPSAPAPVFVSGSAQATPSTPATPADRSVQNIAEPILSIDHGNASSSASASGSGETSFGGYDDAPLQELHKKVDQFIFEENDGVFDGFRVTHTGPIKGQIEIGITPYTDAYAALLMEQLALESVDIERVAVVEGVQAQLLDGEMTILPISEPDLPSMDQPELPSTDMDQPAVSDPAPDTPVSDSDSGSNSGSTGDQGVPLIQVDDHSTGESAASNIAAPSDADAADRSASAIWFYVIGALMLLLAAGVLVLRRGRANR